LKNTGEFYLVDFFDDETAAKIMKKEWMKKMARHIISQIANKVRRDSLTLSEEETI